jgi:ribosomal protein S20
MAPKSSSVIRAMLKRLAEEEEQYKKQKATGSVDAAKPLIARAAAY